MNEPMPLPEGGAPRIRATGRAGFDVRPASCAAPSSGSVVGFEDDARPQAAWWSLVGGNGEVLGHSEVYHSPGNAARGVDDAERVVITAAHRSGRALYDVLREMDAQDAKWGDQSGHPDGTGRVTTPIADIALHYAHGLANQARSSTQAAADQALTLKVVLAASPGSRELRTELIQAAAVFTQWAAAMDRRPGGLDQQAGGRL